MLKVSHIIVPYFSVPYTKSENIVFEKVISLLLSLIILFWIQVNIAYYRGHHFSRKRTNFKRWFTKMMLDQVMSGKHIQTALA